MSYETPICPICGVALAKTHKGELDTWACTAQHGLALTLSEAYEVAQEDELALLWARGKQASPGIRDCPMCEQAMGVVSLDWDSDEIPEGEPGDGPTEGVTKLDLCAKDQVIWFDAGELAELPADRPDPEPSADELAKIDEIRRSFGEQIESAHDDRVSTELSERLIRATARRPGLRRLFHRRSTTTN